MTTFAITRPTLYVVVIRDDSEQIKRVLQLLISILMWIWLHRHQFLQTAESINKIVDIWEALGEATLSFFRILLLPVHFQVGIG